MGVKRTLATSREIRQIQFGRCSCLHADRRAVQVLHGKLRPERESGTRAPEFPVQLNGHHHALPVVE